MSKNPNTKVRYLKQIFLNIANFLNLCVARMMVYIIKSDTLSFIEKLSSDLKFLV